MIESVNIMINTNHKIIISFLIILTLTCSKEPVVTEQVKDERIPVEVIIIKLQSFTEEGIYFGKLEPVEYADLVCYSGGRVDKIDALEGDRVKKGMSLARIDGSRVDALLKTATIQRSIAKSTLDQLKKHLVNGNASQLAVDQQNLTYLNATNSFIEAQKNYRGAFAITPISGVVVRKYIDEFQEIPPNTITFTVARYDTAKVKVGITESDIYNVKKGNEAILSIPMIPEKLWTGKIKQIAGSAGEKDRVFSAEAHFDNRNGYLKPGSSARIQIPLVTYDSAVVVPSELIINDGVNNYVMIVDSLQRVHKQNIVTGESTDNCTMIKSGLSVGDRVISSGFNLVREGMTVSVKKTESQSPRP